jgi:GNAT superfamily N-acetyltransferase
MIRVATIDDIKQIQVIRNLVKENRLSNPSLITDDAVEEHITIKGKGWVYETEKLILGFAIADVKAKNIWALFLHPNIEGKGIGKALHNIMMDWYFTQTNETCWLSTDHKSRAAVFYKMQGWKEISNYGKAEIKLEMSFDNWIKKSRN